MFSDCASLEYLDISNLDTDNLEVCDEMFNGADKEKKMKCKERIHFKHFFRKENKMRIKNKTNMVIKYIGLYHNTILDSSSKE